MGVFLRFGFPLVCLTILQILTFPFSALRRMVQHLRGKQRLDQVLHGWRQPPATDRQRGKPHVVFVGPTLGEYRIMRAISDRLSETAVTFALRDPFSIDRVLREDPLASVVFLPADFLPTAWIWHRRVRPDLIVYVERFGAPVLGWASRILGVPGMLVNARFQAPKHFFHPKGWANRLGLKALSAVLVQREGHLPPLASSCRIESTGNVKLNALPEPASPEPDLLSWIGDLSHSLLVARSVESLEDEEIVLSAYRSLSAIFPCRLLVAPRHPKDFDRVARRLDQRGLSFSRRTQPRDTGAILLLDTLGELRAVYGLGVAAYVGGSMSGSGHNVLEAAAFGIPVSYGPRRGHFADLQILCEEAGVGTRVRDAAELTIHWERVLGDATYREDVRRRAEGLRPESKAAARTAEVIKEILLAKDRQSEF